MWRPSLILTLVNTILFARYTLCTAFIFTRAFGIDLRREIFCAADRKYLDALSISAQKIRSRCPAHTASRIPHNATYKGLKFFKPAPRRCCIFSPQNFLETITPTPPPKRHRRVSKKPYTHAPGRTQTTIAAVCVSRATTAFPEPNIYRESSCAVFRCRGFFVARQPLQSLLSSKKIIFLSRQFWHDLPPFHSFFHDRTTRSRRF